MSMHVHHGSQLAKQPIRVWHLVSRLLGIETFLNFLRVSGSVSKILVSKKSLGIGLENIWSWKKVSVSVSKTFGLEKKSRYWSRKDLVSKKSLGIGLDEIFWSRHSVVIILPSFTNSDWFHWCDWGGGLRGGRGLWKVVFIPDGILCSGNLIKI